MRPQSIEVHIDELVLHGLEVRVAECIAEGLQSELTRLFIERGVPGALRQTGDLGHVRGGAFVAEPGSVTRMTGSSIARAVYRGLNE